MAEVTLLETIVKAIDDKKGSDIQVLDIHEQTGIADYFVICTGNSRPQTKAIADFVEVKVEETLGVKVLRTEGYQEGNWVLLDYSSIIVQIFQPEERAYYNLEKLWGNSPLVDISSMIEAE